MTSPGSGNTLEVHHCIQQLRLSAQILGSCCSGTGSSEFIPSGIGSSEGSVSMSSSEEGSDLIAMSTGGGSVLIVTFTGFSGTEEGSVLIVTSMGSVLIATSMGESDMGSSSTGEGSVLVKGKTYSSDGRF
ncbi:hypothetical protein AVEN_181430-1 [Araneus ventricosus]|uniref:Uncharacterized protein n=1 Tax=Araneus ventricosus TaxID=182803 RepID=A0A4Y2R8L4_ARAVE|nr:hypothetical protein AVEN_181430-1 [Araneus ventricosus]